MARGGLHHRLTTRDYKRPARRALVLSRYREFGIGLLVGALLAGGIALYKSEVSKAAAAPENTPRPEPHRSSKRSAEADASETPAASAETSDRYDFYEMLPNFEVVVPEKDRDVKRDVPAAKIERPGTYVLQAGSYRNLPDADRVRAQLALQGIDAKVQRVAVDNDVWHRVRIGPISDLAELNRVRKQLQAAEVDGLVIRVGD